MSSMDPVSGSMHPHVSGLCPLPIRAGGGLLAGNRGLPRSPSSAPPPPITASPTLHLPANLLPAGGGPHRCLLDGTSGLCVASSWWQPGLREAR